MLPFLGRKVVGMQLLHKEMWVWVKNRVTPKWNPGKKEEPLYPAVHILAKAIDPYPYDVLALVDLQCLQVRLQAGTRQQLRFGCRLCLQSGSTC